MAENPTQNTRVWYWGRAAKKIRGEHQRLRHMARLRERFSSLDVWQRGLLRPFPLKSSADSKSLGSGLLFTPSGQPTSFQSVRVSKHSTRKSGARPTHGKPNPLRSNTEREFTSRPKPAHLARCLDSTPHIGERTV